MRLVRIPRFLAALAFLTACTEHDISPGVVEEEAKDGGPVTLAQPDIVQVDPDRLDSDSGLIIDEHWELVKAHCSACHSVQLVTQNRGDRQKWLEMIRWMQESQGLWAFDAETETAILDYLEKNYPPSEAHRRVPVSPSLLPENPYKKKE